MGSRAKHERKQVLGLPAEIGKSVSPCNSMAYLKTNDRCEPMLSSASQRVVETSCATEGQHLGDMMNEMEAACASAPVLKVTTDVKSLQSRAKHERKQVLGLPAEIGKSVSP